MRNDLWIWGYVLNEIPSRVPFVDIASFCSLETAGEYINAENAFFLNSMHSSDALNPSNLKKMQNFRQVICALEHEHYEESAAKISALSLDFPNITGAILDDFLTPATPAYHMKPETLAAIKRALLSVNPKLKLCVVCYTYMDYQRILPFLDSIDIINLWCWVSTEHFWPYEYHASLQKLREMTGKEVIQGIFLHDFGCKFEIAERTFPQSIEKLELQCELISGQLRLHRLAGWAFLQSGWFSSQSHRKQVQWLRDFLDWHYGTTTIQKSEDDV